MINTKSTKRKAFNKENTKGWIKGSVWHVAYSFMCSKVGNQLENLIEYTIWESIWRKTILLKIQERNL